MKKTGDMLKQLLDDNYADVLVASYMKLQLIVNPTWEHQDIIDDLNLQLGLRTKRQRLMDWRSGIRLCPKRVKAHMRRVLVKYLFADEIAQLLIVLLDLEH